MLTKDLTQVQKFIAELELTEPDPTIAGLTLAAVEPKDGKEGGYVDAGSLVSFVAGVSGQHQKDVLNSTLLAQLAANKKFDRENDTENWYKFYRNVLENVGWVIQEFNFQKYAASGATFSINKVVLEILAAIATQNELAVITTTMNALKSLSDKDDRLVLFDSQSYPASSGNFQISAAAESGGVVVMKIGAFYFKATKHVTKFLWFNFSSSSSEIYKGAQTINLNEEAYSKVRQQIVDKLGDKAQQFVADLDI